ncbi:uncharacterized protein LOC122197255 isoform X1 [Lactuca sativa]|uniref:uncharacterized protein LOC122197255 isoform X1 n=1 Tax=Lactuca sativa TaxID=4236 RepID=UPI001C689D31|nr:uncharacterized protein LOC122197255 isoform X1 [Lactuca sativa]
MFRDWLLSLSSSSITHYNISTYIYVLRVPIIGCCSYLTIVCLVQESGHYPSLAIPWRYDHPTLLAGTPRNHNIHSVWVRFSCIDKMNDQKQTEVIKVYEESIVLGGILLNGK